MPRSALRHLAPAVSLACAALLLAPPCRSDDEAEARRAAAREIAGKGDAMFAEGRCDKAIAYWTQANEQYRAPTLMLRLARCHALLGHVVQASTMLQAIVDEPVDASTPAPFVEAHEQATRELGPVRARIATLQVDVAAPAGVSPAVELDGAPLVAGRPVPVDPGAHEVRVPVASWERRVVLGDGASERLSVSVSVETPPPRHSALKPLGYSLGAVGLTALAVGAGFGIWAAHTASTLGDECGPSRAACPASAQSDIDALKVRALIADVTLASGGVLFLGGAVLVLATPAPAAETPRFHIEPFGLGGRITGTF